MMEVMLSPEEGIAEFDMEDACPGCGGALSVRLRAGSSWAYCAQCHSLQRKRVEVQDDRIEVIHPPAATA